MDLVFLQDFRQGRRGGSLKLRDYFEHAHAFPGLRPLLFRPPGAPTLPTVLEVAAPIEETQRLAGHAAYFVVGRDWDRLARAGAAPGDALVISLVQGMRRFAEGMPLRWTLNRQAVRICVSEAVREAIAPHAQGPLHVIANGVSLPPLPEPRPLAGQPSVFIGGLKRPRLAANLAERLGTVLPVDLATAWQPREAFLARMAAATICVLLPVPSEGFFLPPLEAMALGRAVVTMDAVGNRGHCLDGVNCLVAPPDVGALEVAVRRLAADPALHARLAEAGAATSARHSLGRERAEFHALLARYLAGMPAG